MKRRRISDVIYEIITEVENKNTSDERKQALIKEADDIFKNAFKDTNRPRPNIEEPTEQTESLPCGNWKDCGHRTGDIPSRCKTSAKDCPPEQTEGECLACKGKGFHKFNLVRAGESHEKTCTRCNGTGKADQTEGEQVADGFDLMEEEGEV